MLALLPFLPSLGGEFVYDDAALVAEDPRVAQGAILDAVRSPYWGARHGGLYRPVTTLSYVLNGYAGKSPLPFRVANLALHAAASVLALELARRVLRTERAAFLAACVFAVHPIHVEVAANIVGRAESLGFLLAGGAWLCAVPAAHDRRARGLVLATGLATLACLAKENAVGVALAAPLEVLVLGADEPLSRRLRTATLAAGPAFVAVALAVLARVLALGLHALTPASQGIAWFMNPLATEPLGTRLANLPLLLLVYARNFAFPAHLSPDYGGKYLALATTLHDPRLVVWALGALALLVGPSLASRRRARELAFASLAALLALGPVLQIIPIGTLVGDRLAYAASFAWALVAGVAGESLLAWATSPRATRLAVALVLGLLGGVATNDGIAWRENIPLFVRARTRVPGALQVPLVLASLYVEAEKYDLARDPLAEALAISPDEGGAHLLLGKIERLTGHFHSARRHLERGLALPHLPQDEAGGHLELGLVLLAFNDLEGAARELGISCQLQPDAKNLANLGLVLFRLGERARAKAALEMSLKMAPDQAKAAELRAVIRQCDEKR